MAGRVTDVAEVVEMTTEPKLAKLQRQAGSRGVYGIIKVLLINMNARLHIDNGLTEEIIDYLAKKFIDDEELRWWFTLADVDLLCRRIVAGKYGKFYGHFSEQEFTECLTRYCCERNAAHFYKADKDAVEEKRQEDVGYTVDKEGNLVVPEALKGKGKKKPLRFTYDEAGNITGENPSYWGKVHAQRHKEKGMGEMEHINDMNRLAEQAGEVAGKEGIALHQALVRISTERRTLAKEWEGAMEANEITD